MHSLPSVVANAAGPLPQNLWIQAIEAQSRLQRLIGVGARRVFFELGAIGAVWDVFTLKRSVPTAARDAAVGTVGAHQVRIVTDHALIWPPFSWALR